MCPQLRCACTGDQRQETSPPQLLECDFYDVEEVNRLTQALLVALAAACVEKTSGTFSQRAAVVPDVKKEMLEYLNQQSESYANGGSISQSMKIAGLSELVSHYRDNSVLFTTHWKDQPGMVYIDPGFRAVALLRMIFKGLKICEIFSRPLSGYASSLLKNKGAISRILGACLCRKHFLEIRINISHSKSSYFLIRLHIQHRL